MKTIWGKWKLLEEDNILALVRVLPNVLLQPAERK